MDENDDPKIIRLPVRTPLPASDDNPRVSDEVIRMLAEADPDSDEDAELPEPSTPATMPEILTPTPGLKDPPPHHRNTILCPQCDHWTWLATQHCFHCHYDLFAHVQREVEAKQYQWKMERRERMTRLAVGFGATGFGLILISTLLPQSIGWLVGAAGPAMGLLAYMFLKSAD